MTSNPPTNPDGTPDYGSLLGGGAQPGDPTGALNIWNLPTELAGTRIWFDIGHKTKYTQSHDGAALGPPPSGLLPGVTQSTSSAAPAPTGAASREREVATSHEILRSPVQVMKQIAALSANDPQRFLAIQQALATGAWGSVRLTGAFDPATEKALGTAMLQYVKLSKGAGVGESFTQYLVSTSQRAAKLGEQQHAAGTAPPVYSVTDPTQIRAAAQSAAQAALGQGLSEDQLSQFVSQFQAAQTSAQQTTSGTASSPDLGAEAMQFAQQSDPHGFKQNQRQAFVNTLVNMFAPSGSQRPDMTPVAAV